MATWNTTRNMIASPGRVYRTGRAAPSPKCTPFRFIQGQRASEGEKWRLGYSSLKSIFNLAISDETDPGSRNASPLSDSRE